MAGALRSFGAMVSSWLGRTEPACPASAEPGRWIDPGLFEVGEPSADGSAPGWPALFARHRLSAIEFLPRVKSEVAQYAESRDHFCPVPVRLWLAEGGFVKERVDDSLPIYRAALSEAATSMAFAASWASRERMSLALGPQGLAWVAPTAEAAASMECPPHLSSRQTEGSAAAAPWLDDSPALSSRRGPAPEAVELRRAREEIERRFPGASQDKLDLAWSLKEREMLAGQNTSAAPAPRGPAKRM